MAGLLNETELLSMRETAERALDGTAVIQTKVSVSDGAGGRTTDWTAAGTVACRLAPFLRGKEEVEGDRLTPDTEVVFTFPAETDIGHKSQIVYGGGTFAVVDVKARSQEITRRVTAGGIE